MSLGDNLISEGVEEVAGDNATTLIYQEKCLNEVKRSGILGERHLILKLKKERERDLDLVN